MRFIIILFIALLISICYQYISRKRRLEQITQLREDFTTWMYPKNRSEVSRPSNALFIRLYKPVYGDQKLIREIHRDIGPAIEATQADIIVSFPTLRNQQIFSEQLCILNNLYDHYELQLEEIKTFYYWFDFIIFIPKQILLYLDKDPDTALGKLTNLSWWFFSIAWTVFENRIIDWLKQLFP